MIVWLEEGVRTAGSHLIPAEDARISVLDRGFTIGDGVFETVKVVDGQPFALGRHLERLSRSASVLGIVPPEHSHLRRAVAATIEANRLPSGAAGRLRLTVTHGAGSPADPYTGGCDPTVLITVVPQPPWPATARVAVAPWRRNEHSALAGVKSTSYAENAVALAHARSRGSDEALLLNTAGNVCEGTGSNVVLAMDGRLVTPDLSSGCLPGITRALVLEWCDVDEEAVPAQFLSMATEAFLTSSTRDIHPIALLDDRRLPAPGPLTEAAVAAWAEHTRRHDVTDL